MGNYPCGARSLPRAACKGRAISAGLRSSHSSAPNHKAQSSTTNTNSIRPMRDPCPIAARGASRSCSESEDASPRKRTRTRAIRIVKSHSGFSGSVASLRATADTGGMAAPSGPARACSPGLPARFGLPSDEGGRDFGLFLPMANGGWILSTAAPVLDGSYGSNRDAAVRADALGLDFVMSMAKYRGFGGDADHWRHTLDASLLLAALAEATGQVKLWTTIHPLLQNVAVAAKMVATLDQVSGGRAGLNIVTGAFRDEFAQMGAWPEGIGHDERYQLAGEWTRALTALWRDECVTASGRFVHLDGCMSDPKPARRPFLICAGASAAGRRFAAAHMDALFLAGGDAAELAIASAAAKAQAAALNRRLRTYAMVTLVLADSDAAAEAEVQRFREGLDEGALRGMCRAYGVLDAEIGRENDFVRQSRSAFMTAHVAGAPETVAARLAELMERTGLDGLMLIFPDYRDGLARFGAGVLPALRAGFGAPTYPPHDG